MGYAVFCFTLQQTEPGFFFLDWWDSFQRCIKCKGSISSFRVIDLDVDHIFCFWLSVIIFSFFFFWAESDIPNVPSNKTCKKVLASRFPSCGEIIKLLGRRNSRVPTISPILYRWPKWNAFHLNSESSLVLHIIITVVSKSIFRFYDPFNLFVKASFICCAGCTRQGFFPPIFWNHLQEQNRCFSLKAS